VWWGVGVVICLERGADLHMFQLMPLPLTVSCFSKIQIGFTFLVPAHLGSPGKRSGKWGVCVFCDSVLVTDCGPQKSYKAGFVYNGGIFFYSTSGHYGLQVWLSCVRVLLRICSELIRDLQIVQFTVCADEMFPDCKPFKQLFKQNCGQWWCFATRMFSHLIIFRGNQPYIMKISTLSKLQ